MGQREYKFRFFIVSISPVFHSDRNFRLRSYDYVEQVPKWTRGRTDSNTHAPLTAALIKLLYIKRTNGPKNAIQRIANHTKNKLTPLSFLGFLALSSLLQNTLVCCL